MCGLSRQLLQVFTIYFKFITKCDKCYYKVRQVLQSVTILLQSATIITKCDSTWCILPMHHAIHVAWNQWVTSAAGGGGTRQRSGRIKTQPKYIKGTCSLRNRRRFLGGRKKPRTACKKNNRRLLRSYADRGACGNKNKWNYLQRYYLSLITD